MSSWVAAVFATLLVLLAGGWRPKKHRLLELPFRYALGALGLHLSLTAAHLLGLRWSLLWVGATGVLGWISTRHRTLLEAGAASEAQLRWGLILSAFLVLGVMIAAFQGWLTQPDFFYHWGLKAARYFESRTVDYGFFQNPSAWRTHPDYPNLVPELFLLPAFWAGAFDETAALSVGASWFALLVLAFRLGLLSAGLRGFRLELVHAWASAVLLSFAVAHPLVGSADVLPACALLLTLPPLLAEAQSPVAVEQLSLGAALAAASKIEGVPLSLVLMALGTWKFVQQKERWTRIAGGWSLMLAVILPWWAMARLRQLFLPSNVGPLELGRLGDILWGWAWAASLPEWNGVPWMLLILPGLLLVPKFRLAALACLGHLAVQLGAYLTAEGVDLRMLLLTSSPRLLFQVVPASLVLVMAWALRHGSREGVRGWS